VELCLKEKYRGGLKHLDKFSHVVVIWWPHRTDAERYRKMLRIKPFYAPDTKTGIFATRAPFHPNPIAITTCHIEEVHEDIGTVLVRDIDAEEGTPILDLKPYFPSLDMATDVRIPDWVPQEWGEPLPDEGVGPE
jgi:tRNA-Thr(GGU) m(6)t(6)A37 methyltransferase TsaA